MSLRSHYRGSSDFSMRHNGTYVGIRMTDGYIVPYYVNGVSGFDLLLTKMSESIHGDNSMSVSIEDHRLVLTRPECGMFNVVSAQGESAALYLSIVPARQIKRSLSLQHRSICGMDRSARPYGNVSMNEHSTICKMLDTYFNDEYPVFSVALQSIKTGNGSVLSVAFSREFALGITPNCIALFYKGKAVGYVDHEDNVNLLPGYEYLDESLMEATLCL